MENNNKGLKITIIFLVIIILGLIGYISYDKFLSNKEEKNETKMETKETVTTSETSKEEATEKEEIEKEVYDYLKMKGVYYVTSPSQDIEHYELTLYENGLYHYEVMYGAETGTIGNYTIVNDEIHLNQFIRHGSDAALHINLNNKILKINSTSEIIDNNPEGSSNPISLKRDDSRDMMDINNLIENEEVFNNAHQFDKE